MDPFLHSLLVSFSDILYPFLILNPLPRFSPWPFALAFSGHLCFPSPDYSPANFPSHFGLTALSLARYSSEEILHACPTQISNTELISLSPLRHFPPRRDLPRGTSSPQGGPELPDPAPVAVTGWIQSPMDMESRWAPDCSG